MRRRRGPAEVARLVAEFQAAGVSRTEFCRRHGLALSTLNRYQRRISPSTPMAGADQWLKVELSGGSRAGGSNSGSSGVTLILAGGRRIEVGRGFDASTLIELVRVLDGA